MQKIEINTTQNVVIQYDLATLLDRFLAYLLDVVIMGSSMLVFSVIFSIFLNQESIVYFIILPIFFLYTVLFEILNDGQSLGKKAMNLRVVKLTGKEAELSDYLIRWVFRALEIYFSLGSIAAIFISSSTKNQRLGDLLANTTVIKIKPSMDLKLEDILKISSREDYLPKYPDVKKLKEEEMLLVKNVLERNRKYPNEAHKRALEETARNIKQRLSLNHVSENDINFLKTLIKDYIVLTR